MRKLDAEKLLLKIDERINSAKTTIDTMPDKAALECNPWLETQYNLGIKHALLDLKAEIKRGDYDQKENV